MSARCTHTGLRPCREPVADRDLCATHLRRLVRGERIAAAQRAECAAEVHELLQEQQAELDERHARLAEQGPDPEALNELLLDTIQQQQALIAAQGSELQRQREALGRALVEMQCLRDEAAGLRVVLEGDGGPVGVRQLCQEAAGLVAPKIEMLLASVAPAMHEILSDARGAIPLIEVSVRACRAKGKDVPNGPLRARAMQRIETLRRAGLGMVVVALKCGGAAQIWVFAYEPGSQRPCTALEVA